MTTLFIARTDNNTEEKKQEDKNYPIFKDLRSQLKEYEIMVTSLESSLGPGLLSVHYDELMQLFHTLIFIEEYDKNKGTKMIMTKPTHFNNRLRSSIKCSTKGCPSPSAASWSIGSALFGIRASRCFRRLS